MVLVSHLPGPFTIDNKADISPVWVFFFFPELKGRSIESMDMLFENSTFSMRKHAYPTEAEKALQEDEEAGFKEGAVGSQGEIKEVEVMHEETSKR